MKAIFDQELMEKARATPEQIEMAKKHGEPFRFEDGTEGVVIIGYTFKGVAYVMAFENIK